MTVANWIANLRLEMAARNQTIHSQKRSLRLIIPNVDGEIFHPKLSDLDAKTGITMHKTGLI
jgi:hypothetical protein